MDFSLLLSSYATVWSNPEVLLMTFIGALGGVLLGAIPGMTATMGVALLIPFSFGMDLIPSIGLLLGIYCGGMYGGSISAILIHAPGTPTTVQLSGTSLTTTELPPILTLLPMRMLPSTLAPVPHPGHRTFVSCFFLLIVNLLIIDYFRVPPIF